MAPAIGACWRGKGCQQSWSFPVDRQPGLGRENRQYKDIDSAMKDTVLFFRLCVIYCHVCICDSLVFPFARKTKTSCSLAVSGGKACVDMCDFGSFSFVARPLWLWRRFLRWQLFVYMLSFSSPVAVGRYACHNHGTPAAANQHPRLKWVVTHSLFLHHQKNFEKLPFYVLFLHFIRQRKRSSWVTVSKLDFLFFFSHHLCSRETASCIYVILAVNVL